MFEIVYRKIHPKKEGVYMKVEENVQALLSFQSWSQQKKEKHLKICLEKLNTFKTEEKLETLSSHLRGNPGHYLSVILVEDYPFTKEFIEWVKAWYACHKKDIHDENYYLWVFIYLVALKNKWKAIKREVKPYISCARAQEILDMQKSRGI